MASREQATRPHKHKQAEHMASRTTTICLSSDSDSDDLVKSARREAARRAAVAQEQKLREEAYERDVAAALAVGTGPEAVKKPVVSDTQMQQLVSSYRRHFGDYCADRAKRNKCLTQYFPYVVWEKVYEDFKAKFSDVQLEQSVLKTCMRAGLRDPKFWQTVLPVAAARSAPVAPLAVRSSLTSTFRVPVASVSATSAHNPNARPHVAPAAAAAKRVVNMTLLSSANPQAPSEPQALQLGSVASTNQPAAAEESRQLILQEQYDNNLKRRVRENDVRLKELKKQKLVLENLKLARELNVVSRAECVEQGDSIIEKWKQ